VIDAGNPLLTDLRSDISIEEFIAVTLRPFDQMSKDGQPIAIEALQIKREVGAAQRRSRNASEVLTYDLDGDFKVTLDEVEKVTRSNRTRSSLSSDEEAITHEIQRFMSKHDINKDGIVELSEAIVDSTRRPGRTRIEQIADTPLGADGQVTRAELKKLAERTFAAVDKNRDGKVSREEFNAITQVRAAARRD
jgi:Ca2+-binding EF-hand superfamily protein